MEPPADHTTPTQDSQNKGRPLTTLLRHRTAKTKNVAIRVDGLKIEHVIWRFDRFTCRFRASGHNIVVVIFDFITENIDRTGANIPVVRFSFIQMYVYITVFYTDIIAKLEINFES